ncbi:hypothetical protein B0H15DRAFT_411631 [Mycena belliarum]|uniref:F-box domain-containing protein n=1 Tax=Mycena belliarum TaxID=1033014 RepID=A0AAD6UFB1_9AGAR|nr:hypothetical protein B0H15DRAFT_411631 [Mycena belliae]
MHHCLGIPEIISLICGELAGPYSYLSPANKGALAALARTSRDFQGPALEILWKKQETLENILKCLPSNLWEANTGMAHHMRIKGHIQQADWERPLQYASRVQELTLRFRVMPKFIIAFPDVNVLEAIESSLPREYICPNLRTIHWEPTKSEEFPYICLFLGANVTSAQILLPQSTRSNISLLPHLALRYQQLKNLCIHGGLESVRLCRASSAIAMNLDAIEAVSMDRLDRMALEHLSGLPSLKTLALRIPRVSDLGPPSLTHSPYMFSALRTVDFLATTIDFAIAFVNLLGTCSVEQILVGTGVLATKDTTSALYTALACHLSHSALQELSVNNVDGGTIAPTPATIANYVVGGYLVAALFCFKNLTSLRLAPPVGFDLDDDTAWDMARAWPKIQHLSLTAATALHHTTSMSLRGLRAFAAHCHELRTLSITVDASTIPPFDYSPGTSLCQHALYRLDVAVSPISDPPNVARFMSALFPALAVIRTLQDWRWNEEVSETVNEETAVARQRHTQWKEVEKLIPIFAAVRQEERRRAAASFCP